MTLLLCKVAVLVSLLVLVAVVILLLLARVVDRGAVGLCRHPSGGSGKERVGIRGWEINPDI